jgi:hypothetical protein
MNIYKGEILKDLTSFTFAQQLLDKRGGEGFFLIDLDSIIESLLFHTKILVIPPTYPNGFTPPPLPPIIEELTKRGLVDICLPTFPCGKDDLSIFLKETIQLVPQRKVAKIYQEHRKIQDLIKCYDTNFQISTNPEIVKLAREAGIRQKKIIPLYSLLVRTHIHMKYIHERGEKEERKVPYSPSIMRILMETMIDSYRTRGLSLFTQILKKLEFRKEMEIEALNQFQTSFIKLRLPLLTGMILPHCKEPWDVLEVASNLRNEKKVRRFREFLTVYQNAIYENDRELIEKCEKQLGEVYVDLNEEYRGGTVLRRIKIIPLLITLFGIATQNIPSIFSGLASSMEPFLNSLLRYFRRRNLVFLYELKEKERILANFDKETERIFGIQIRW